MNVYEKNKENTAKVARFLKGNLINFCVIVISVAYVFFGLLDVEQTDTSIWVVLCEGLLGIVTGFLIKQALGETGYGKGYNSKIWGEEIAKYNDLCNNANPYMEYVDNFYACQEIEKIKKYRKTRLLGVRLKYQDFFDKYGQYINEKEIISPRQARKLKKRNEFDKNTMIVLDARQRQALHSAIKVKIYNLNLFSEYEVSVGSYTKKEETDKAHKAKTLGKNGITSILIACIGSYFTVQWIKDFNVAEFIFSILQVCLWIALGAVQLYNNYNYVVIDKVNKLKTKKELIQKFIFGCKQELYNESPYDVFEREIEAKGEE